MMTDLPLPGMLASRSKTILGVEVAGLYALFITSAFVVYHVVANCEFSAILTLSAMTQCLAFSLLGVQAFSWHGLEGVSLWSLQLDAVAIACRLSSTLFFDAYLPVDKTGDFLYQTFDCFSLTLVLGLAYKACKLQRTACETEDKQVERLAIGAFLLAALCHADLDDNAIFDTMWMYSTFLSAIAVIPQLWSMARSQDSVPALTIHFIAMMTLGRALSGLYVWHVYDLFTCDPWAGGFNHAAFAVLCAHALYLLLIADFAYFYCKNAVIVGLQSLLRLPQAKLGVRHQDCSKHLAVNVCTGQAWLELEI